MESGKFLSVAANNMNPNWEALIARESPLPKRENDIRSAFNRDYTRILHSLAYRRLKHKTQVLFNTQNDHVCTRIEHVNHVESVSYTIAKFLGLNTELTRAIAAGHDLGHAPFGHEGEKALQRIANEYLKEDFWHEKNSLHFVDNIELLEDHKRNRINLCLTYAVRDGIISHCGEIDEDRISPRRDPVDLYKITAAGNMQPFTWEACVVKLSDKIAYLGRDIEDARRINFITNDHLRELYKISKKYGFATLNTTIIMHELIVDLCSNSTPEKGLALTPSYIDMMNEVKDFNYNYIYNNDKFIPYKEYVDLVIMSIFNTLKTLYDGENTLLRLVKIKTDYRNLYREFSNWISLYSDLKDPAPAKLNNKKIYGKLNTKEIYIKAILEFISSMTDQYAIKIFDELTVY
jgi:dGTPase